ncbi:MAG: homoserine O-acetyltransferase [Chloroflexi bacterium]|nr:homoserine O-acetyltransferase [Chloroflexota bacterium]MCC6564616.1 homoserine O-acetyltransferase [Chloroflexota bacterium]MCO6442908.1 homoserine O-acetyltransferase [Anaerolineae bacterium]MDL1915345.1 homoserine O-acetyltransferase [Anaerolineae bacterium CFX4]GIK29931.1 MAG: homoserine O-acetyltransferase [Chloroflexota bacterium]
MDYEQIPARRLHGSVGIVQTHYAHFNDPLMLKSGQMLDRFTLAYETYGTLNADRSNAILVCHALSGDAHAGGYHSDDPHEPPGWWDSAIGPGKMFDTSRYFVICSNVIGGCRGSTGPASLAPGGEPYGLRFPVVTVRDMVEAQRRLIDYLGITQLWAVAGGSMGAMQALEWGVAFPDRAANVLFIASTPRSTPLNVALNEVGRQAIYNDPRWNEGAYYHQRVRPTGGLAVARMLGHISYMSDAAFERKFGRRYQFGDEPGYSFDTDFAVESYLKHQGEKFNQRFDANSYLYITKALDYFNIADGYGSLESALSRLHAGVLIVTFSSDWLYPPQASIEMARVLSRLDKRVEHYHVDADHGHDSFLLEVNRMDEIVSGFLDRAHAEANSTAA